MTFRKTNFNFHALKLGGYVKLRIVFRNEKTFCLMKMIQFHENGEKYGY